MLAKSLRQIADKISPQMFARIMTLYPPFIGAGITVKQINSDYTYVKVNMKLTWYNRNYVGTQFGGSLYAMTDPFYMLMLLHNLGRQYIVWDKAAAIDFIKPGTGRVYAEFKLSKEQIDQIKNTVDQQGKHVFDLPVEIKNSDSEVIARVIKTLYVRKKI